MRWGALFFVSKRRFLHVGNWAGRAGANGRLTTMAVEPGLPWPLGGTLAVALSSPGASAGGTVSPAHPLWGFSASIGTFLLDKE